MNECKNKQTSGSGDAVPLYMGTLLRLPQTGAKIRSGGNNFAQVSLVLRQRDSRGYPHQRDSFVVAFAIMYSSSDEEEALLLLALEDEEISRFVFLSDHCRSYIIFFPRDMQNLFFQEKKKEVGL